MIFSGDESRKFWATINKVRDEDEKVHAALYLMGCKLQELESLVRSVSKALSTLLPPQ